MFEHFKEILGEERHNQILQEAIGKTYEEILDERNRFEARIDKAIKLIEEIQNFPHTNENQHRDMKELKEILKGEDHE